ncbi:hypothetical protein ACFWB2_29680 [Streptomyces virginiae]|uniref:hypothetical protein n=1 Tax=Streptomyces virginiae TaxID=1961 RepID=UPI00364DDCBE
MNEKAPRRAAGGLSCGLSQATSSRSVGSSALLGSFEEVVVVLAEHVQLLGGPETRELRPGVRAVDQLAWLNRVLVAVAPPDLPRPIDAVVGVVDVLDQQLQFTVPH